MRIFSEKVNYGVAALFELAKNYSQGCLQAKEISDRQNIPKNYLIQLMIILKKAGFVYSIRGVNGGYQLVYPPYQVMIIDIIEALEGSLTLIENSNAPDSLNSFWSKVEKDFKNLLAISLDDLVRRGQVTNFDI
jgi:Rrf2 family protein